MKVKTLREVQDLAKISEAEIERRNRILLTNNQKDIRFFTQVEAIEYLAGVDRDSLLEHCIKLELDPKNKDENSQWLVDINEIYAVRSSLRETHPDLFPPKFKRSKKQKPQIICVGNQKGGTGKTTGSVTLASYLASQKHEEYRILFIDLDAQGTGSMYYKPNRNEPEFADKLSAGDFLKGRHLDRMSNGESLKEIVMDSMQDTTIPNLKIIPAKETDRDVDTQMTERVLKQEVTNPYEILKEVLASVEDEIDIVILDTPPAINHSVYNALNASTTLLVVVQPAENDVDATFNWLTHLPSMFETLDEFGFTGYDNEIKFLFMNNDGKNTAMKEMDRFNEIFGSHVLPATLESSEAIRHCSTNKNTIFDISKADYTIPGKARTYKKPFEKAIINGTQVGNQVLKIIRDAWTEQEKVN